MLKGNPVLPPGGPLLACSKNTSGYAFRNVWCLPDYSAPGATEPQDLVPCLSLVLLRLPGLLLQATTVPPPGISQHSFRGGPLYCPAHFFDALFGPESLTSSLQLQSLLPSPFKSLVFSFMHPGLEELKGNLCVASRPY